MWALHKYKWPSSSRGYPFYLSGFTLLYKHLHISKGIFESLSEGREKKAIFTGRLKYQRPRHKTGQDTTPSGPKHCHSDDSSKDIEFDLFDTLEF